LPAESPVAAQHLKDYLIRRVSPRERYEDILRFPRYFEIETVNACNARCPMCTIEEWNRHSPTMKDDLFDKIADEVCAHANEVQRVSLYRDGEPLLDKKMGERIARLKAGGIRQVAISTNVGLLTERRAREILSAGLDIIILSIDSLVKEIFESIRVRLVMEEVLANALRFIELRNQMGAKTQIWVRMIRQESNFDEWPEFEKFWRARLSPGDRCNFHYLHNWGDQLKGFVPVAETYEPKLPCIALWSLMVIFADGRVPLCNVDYNDKYPTGSVLTNSIAEVWQSKIMEERRQLHLTGEKSCISLCGNCNVWDEPPDRQKVAPGYAEAVSLAMA
jgi:pyruvate-formate lyase-activating enzyme